MHCAAFYRILTVMIKIVLRVCLMGAALYFSILYLSGISLVTDQHGFIVSFSVLFALFAGIEIILYPVMRLVILPLRLLTFGFASLVLSVLLVYAVSFFHPPFVISSVFHAVLLGVTLGFARAVTK